MASNSNNFEDIPQPPEHMFGLLGNLPDIDPSFPMKEIWRMQDIYGPIMKLNLASPRIFVGSQRLVNEVCDQKRFQKAINTTLVEVRALLGDGLFTAYNKEPNWGKAHRMLIAAFGPLGIRKMFDGMQDIASQMVLRWDRLGPDHQIVCSDDLTRLAFDTIGLCAFSFRFNEFYSDDPHPFAQQMADVLTESGKKASRPKWAQGLYRSSEQTRQDNVAKMHKLCDQIVADRRQNPQPDNNDLLNTMMNTKDKETGEGLTDENIRFQLATFLVAGHETTSATLSFTYLNLLKNPEKMLKAQQQVDEILGDNVMTVEYINKLDYLDACIKETLRLSSPISGSTMVSEEDQVLGGKYFVPKGTAVTVSNRTLHRDPEVWGDDVETYRPERFLNGGFANLPPNSWKPFGNGARACIGRGFAEQEMILNLAMVLQRFQLELADPTYELQLKSTLTIKPWNFRMKARRRAGKSINVGIPGGIQKATGDGDKGHAAQESKATEGDGKPLPIFFGGNTGTCEALAQSLKGAAGNHGYKATISSLDGATEHVPTDGPAVFITASYEGLPPDNAKKFVSWLEGLKDNKTFNGVQYAVFGVGNSDWPSTYHRIPKLVDELLAKNGASRIAEFGSSNVKEDLFGPWEDWYPKLLSSISGGKSDSTSTMSSIQVEITKNPLTKVLGSDQMNYGTIMVNRELAGTQVGPAKRHVEVKLPEHQEYIAGDYLVVQPHNPPDVVHRVTAFFGLNEHDILSIKGTSKEFLTGGTPIGEFLTSSIELTVPITKRQLENVATYAKPEQKEIVAKLIDGYKDLLSKRYSVLDVLEETSIPLPFGQFVDMLPPLAPRMYSISSSPLQDAETVSLTMDVHESPALSGHGIFQGVASNYLASRRVGDRISCFVRPTNVGFRIPPSETPLIMMAAGTGIAPMRAFLHERAAIAKAGVRKLGPATLYFGCRHPEKDYIYKDELAEFEKLGIVKVKTAFSKVDGGHQYVPDLVWEDREEVADMFQAGGLIFLCGSAARLGKSCADVCKKIYSERSGKSEKEAEEWLQRVRKERFVSDVY